MPEPVSVDVPTPVGPPVRSVRAEMEVPRPEPPPPFSTPAVWAKELTDRFRQPIGEAGDHLRLHEDLLDVVGGRPGRWIGLPDAPLLLHPPPDDSAGGPRLLGGERALQDAPSPLDELIDVGCAGKAHCWPRLVASIMRTGS